MPDSPDASNLRDLVSQSSDQAASYPPQACGRYDAPEGNAYAPGGHVTPNQAFLQGSPLIYPNQSLQQPQQIAPGPFLSHYSFDPYAQAAWDWSQSADVTQLPTPYEPQGELIQELRERKSPANDFSNPLLVNPLSPPPRPLPQRPAVSLKMKRKSDALAELQTMLQQSANEQQNPSKRRGVSRTSSTTQSPASTVLADAQPSPIAASANQSSIQGNGEAQRRKNASMGTGPQGREVDVSEPRRVVESSGSGDMLPAGKVFPIQIGSVLFSLSGASLSSDAPSYFSHFFNEQLRSNGGRANDVRTLYIDRDPETFRDIALHLQGYHIVPHDGEHFVKLFADAQFYSLPRLTKQLFKSDIFISIGSIPFRIPRDSFSAPGDSPNYFSLGFAQWFSTPSEVFPGLDRSVLLRPPSISPPSVPNKSGEIFGELMKMLQGYEVEIRSETHRANLLRDARYYHLKGLEQRLVPCEITHNLKRGQSEILMRLEDIRQSGISFAPDPTPNASDTDTGPRAGFVSYARPYTDDATAHHILILETSSSESTTLILPPSSSASPPNLDAQVVFHGDTLRRMTSLSNIITSKMGLPSTQTLGLHAQTAAGLTEQSATRVRVRVDGDCALTLDGEEVEEAVDAAGNLELKHDTKWVWGRGVYADKEVKWVVRRAQWRVRVEPVGEDEDEKIQVILYATKIEAHTKERCRNAERAFLGGA